MSEQARYGGIRPDTVALQSSLADARSLEHVGRTQDAVNLIHRVLDAALRDGQFQAIDQMLERMDADLEGVDMLLSVLTATLPARDTLAHRAALFHAVERTLRSRALLEPGLLDGLE